METTTEECMPQIHPRLRIGIVGFFHESNTFIPESTTLAHYQRCIFLLGGEVREKYGDAHHEISGFFETLDAEKIDAVPILFASTPPWGKVSHECLSSIWQAIDEGLHRAGKLDGILAATHGAAISEFEPDMDGWWLTRLRRHLGPGAPLIATMDPHANLSPAMVEACDALVAYRENPHLDQRQRGIEAAKLMAGTLRGEIRPVIGACFPPIAINIERQLTSEEPLLGVQRELDQVRALPGVLSASLALGFPYADIPDMGSAFVVVTDGDRDLAREQADKLAAWLVEHREFFRGQLLSPEEAWKKATSSPKPVGLLDMGDNVGGGAPGDSVVLARLAHSRSSLRTLVYLVDPESAHVARKAGPGHRVRLRIGGKLPMSPTPPLEVEATVLGIHDGKYSESQPRHGGKTGGDIGMTAVVETDSGLTVMLMSARDGVSASIQPILACALEPGSFDVIIIKGVHAPVAAFAEICPTLIRVNTPGVTTADMSALTYHHRRQPMFPFEDIGST